MANVGIYDMTDTWNNAGTAFTAIKMNVADAASAAGSKLLDIQKGGSSYLELNKSGELGILDKIFHIGDTNTAIRFPAADTVTVETAGSEALRIDSSGRVLAGTTAARSNFNNTTETAKLQIEGQDVDTASLSVVRYLNTASSVGGLLRLGRTRGTAANQNTLVSSGDGLGYIEFSGSDGNEMVRAAFLSSEVDGTAAANDMPGRLIFATTPSGSATPTERMRIDSSGNVGIGNTSPSSYNSGSNDLVIGDSSGGDRGLSIITGTANTGYITFHDATGTTRTGGFEYRHNGDDLLFRTANAERMRITSGGNVGIGTTSPGLPLHVANSVAEVIRLERTGANAGTVDLSLFGVGATSYFALGGDRIASGAIGNLTTASAANVFIGTDSNAVGFVLHRSTSSRKYKTEIHDAEFGLSDLAKLRPVTYKGINDGDKVFGGLIAEEVHDAGLEMFVQYDDEGEPESLAYTHMVALCVKAIQEQQSIIESLESRLAALENA